MGYLFGGKKGSAAVGRDTVVKLPQVPETMRRPSDHPSDREKIETEIIKSLIESYFDIVRKNFLDMVPKTIMHFMVNHAKENLQNGLVTELYKEDLLEGVMKETDDVAQRRAEVSDMRAMLERALEIVNEIRGTSGWDK